MKKYKLSLALSGGGIRGVAHIGAIKALQENDIEPEAVIGTSAGAIIGALYAAGKSPEEMMEFVKEWSFLKSVRIGFTFDGLTNLSFLKEHLNKYLGFDDFSKLEKPFYVGVTNMNKGTLEVLSEGSIGDAVMASSAIPIVFKPVEINGNIYVDGGVMCNLAIEPLRKESETLIGINVMATSDVETKSLSNVLGIGQRLFNLSIVASARESLERCDIVLNPPVGSYQIFKILQKNFTNMYEAGYNEAMEQMPQILEKAKAHLAAA